MHVEYAEEVSEGKRLYVTEVEYARLIQFIKGSFKFVDGKLGQPIDGYFPTDKFYQAAGSYHLFNTCNTWTNRGLKLIKQRTALWTPYKWGITLWL